MKLQSFQILINQALGNRSDTHPHVEMMPEFFNTGSKARSDQPFDLQIIGMGVQFWQKLFQNIQEII